MSRLLLTTCLALVLAACGADIKRGKQLLEDSLPIPDDIEYRQVKSFPGDVVCGEYSGFVSHHEPKVGFRPFIVVGDEVITTPRSRQLAIYCSEDPAASLLAETGIGLFTADNRALSKITADFAALAQAIEAYYQANSSFPTVTQTLQQLVEPSGIGRPPRNFPEGGYLAAIPRDPWGEAYLYEEDQWAGAKGQYRIYTLGADGAPGGSGEAMDIGIESLPYLSHVANVLGLSH